VGLWPLTRNAGQIPPGTCMSVSCECCVLSEVSGLGCSLVQRSLTEGGVSECDLEASIIRKPLPTIGCCTMKKCGASRGTATAILNLGIRWR